MKISSITDIVGGVLKNTPSISFVYNIKTNPKRVVEGDLFIARNKKDLLLAVEHGAFAILYDFDTPILDNEIAWIKVDSCDIALIKLFRFKLSSLDLKAYYCDFFTYELLALYKTTHKNIKLISENLENSIKIIENIKENDVIFCTNREVLDKIYPNNYNFNSDSHELTNKTSHSLFESSFSYRDHYFSRVKLPSLYIDQFLDVYTFLSKHFELTKLKKISNLRPLFLDKFINIIEYGRSDKFIVAQKNINLIGDEISFIKKNYKYAKTIYITNQFLEGFEEEQYVVSSAKKLKSFLKDKKFNCAYLIGYDLQKVEKVLNNSTNTSSLF